MAGPFCEGLASVHSGKSGFINRQNEMIIPAIYDDIIDPFFRGRARVQMGDEVILIDKTGATLQILNEAENEAYSVFINSNSKYL